MHRSVHEAEELLVGPIMRYRFVVDCRRFETFMRRGSFVWTGDVKPSLYSQSGPTIVTDFLTPSHLRGTKCSI